jgi:hypothetical protein
MHGDSSVDDLSSEMSKLSIVAIFLGYFVVNTVSFFFMVSCCVSMTDYLKGKEGSPLFRFQQTTAEPTSTIETMTQHQTSHIVRCFISDKVDCRARPSEGVARNVYGATLECLEKSNLLVSVRVGRKIRI